MEIESAIAMRFLGAGDVLILDNAANHTGKGNSVLEELLWQEHMVLVLFLPARAPEWNPIELMRNCLMQWLKYFDLSYLTGSHRVLWQLLQPSSMRFLMKRFIASIRRVEFLHCMDIKSRS
jgi:hypothetical protein